MERQAELQSCQERWEKAAQLQDTALAQKRAEKRLREEWKKKEQVSFVTSVVKGPFNPWSSDSLP